MLNFIFGSVPDSGTNVNKKDIFVPYIGTKDDERAIFVQFQMTNTQRREILDILYKSKDLGIDYINSITIDSNKFQELKLPNTIEDLQNHIKYCNLCNLSKKSDSIMLGSGDYNSDIYIVSPSSTYFQNDLILNIFQNMIEKVLLLKYNDIYITNILKCTTNESLSQLSSEIELCKSYLDKQLDISKPKIIIALGSAFNNIMKTHENIIEISGKIYDYKGIKLIPLIDPEFIYKNPSYKQDVYNDLKKIKNLLEIE